MIQWVCKYLFLLVGERVVGRGSDLYQLCKDIDDTIKGMCLDMFAIISDFTLTCITIQMIENVFVPAYVKAVFVFFL